MYCTYCYNSRDITRCPNCRNTYCHYHNFCRWCNRCSDCLDINGKCNSMMCIFKRFIHNICRCRC